MNKVVPLLWNRLLKVEGASCAPRPAPHQLLYRRLNVVASTIVQSRPVLALLGVEEASTASVPPAIAVLRAEADPYKLMDPVEVLIDS